MNITKHLTLAVILGHFATSDVTAQEPDPDTQTTVKAAKTAPVDEPPLTDPDPDGDAERNKDADDDCGQQIDMSIQDNEILVTNGQPGALVALVIGFEEASFYLGSAHIQLLPIAVLALGSFDEHGEYRWRLSPGISAAPVTVKIQAITQDEAGCFSASDRWTLNYHGEDQFDGSPDVTVALLKVRGLEGAIAATRRLAA